MKGLCFGCLGWCFFKPFSDGTLSCCGRRGETVEDIDLNTGVSPLVQKHNIDGVPCKEFAKGRGACDTPRGKPFNIPKIREKGEKYLLKQLKIV